MAARFVLVLFVLFVWTTDSHQWVNLRRRELESLALTEKSKFMVNQEAYSFVNRLCELKDSLYITFFQQEPIVVYDKNSYQRKADIPLQIGPQGAYQHSHMSVFPSRGTNTLYVLDRPFGSSNPQVSVIWQLDTASGDKKIWLEVDGDIAFTVSPFSGNILVFQKSTSSLSTFSKTGGEPTQVAMDLEGNNVVDITELPNGNVVLLSRKAVGSNVYYVAQFNPAGSLNSRIEIETEAGGQDQHMSMTVDVEGNVYVNSVKKVFAVDKATKSSRLILDGYGLPEASRPPFWMTGLYYSLDTQRLYVAAYEIGQANTPFAGTLQLGIQVYDVTLA